MAALNTITAAVRDSFTSSGIEAAICEYPAGEKMRYDKPVLSIGVKSGSGVSSGFSEYMGERYDIESDTYSELYGKRLEIVLGVHIYSPRVPHGAAGCISVFSEIAAATGNFPLSLRVREISCGETEFDTVTGMFHCLVELKCLAYMYAVKTDDTELLDFKLKGVLS